MVLGTKKIAMNRRDKIPAFMKPIFWAGGWGLIKKR